MIRSRIRAVSLYGCLTVCLGQVPRIVADVAVAEAEYRDAQVRWVQNDPNLEKDLYSAKPEEMRGRIRRAASLRDDVMVKKGAYLNLLIQRVQNMRNRLDRSANGTLPTEALKKDLESQQSRILGDQERLDALLRDLPPGDEYSLVRRALEGERTDLVNLQNNVALRIHSLSTAAKAQEAIESSTKGDPLAPKLDAILKVWEAERTSADRHRASWAGVYAAMEKSLDDKAESAAPPKGKKRDARQPASPPAKVNDASSTTWLYRSQPNGWTGYGEPEMVTLELTGENDALTGTYTARLPVRGGVHAIRLSLKGQRKADAAVLSWVSQTPKAEGELRLKFGADGRLLVERTQSSDSYVPHGMEVLTRR